ncbi:hypothetical protein TCAL_10143 [Tigriopus californicus]|uniref:Ionotropic glutamate receptor L-glutamate and glycine-binding domain-containing protein n=1 Tax=Tigriopus californicus TaxID=6832 RepID=A0A553PFX0_TIGCA|nr:hypothetical protein TCAL_10143 [Tigriopus californicus]
MDTPSRKHMLVGAEDWPPWFLINSFTSPNFTSFSYGGIMWDVLLQLSRSMNFTFSIIRPPDGKWGVLEANGSWNGMVGMVSRKEVDFALGPFGMSAERSEVIDFSFPLRQDILVTVTPVRLVPDLWVIWRPFGIKVWITFCVTFISFLILFGISDKLFLKQSRWGQIMEFLLRTLAGDGSVPLPRTWNYQLFFTMTWILAMFILGQGYSGTLASLMTIPKVPKMIEDVSDLVDQGDIPWGLETGTILEQTGSKAQTGSLLHKFYSGAQKLKGSCYADLDKIKDGKLARLCEGLTAMSMLSDDFSKEGKCYMYADMSFFSTSTEDAAY